MVELLDHDLLSQGHLGLDVAPPIALREGSRPHEHQARPLRISTIP